MARLGRKESLAPQKGNKDSGRTIARMLQRGGKKNSGCESRPMRSKNQPKPTGRARFPFGKYRTAGTKIDGQGRVIEEK